MRVAVIGTGYVGLVSGACFAHLGAAITCLDIDAAKIGNLKKGVIPIFENGLEEIVKNAYSKGLLKFSTDISGEIETADMVFIAVGTPSAKDGSADLTYIFEAANAIAANAKDGVIVVTKSTVPVGTNDKISDKIKAGNPSLKFHIASNPEFLREGNAVKDFLEPDRVVIGAENSETFEKIATLYRPIDNVKILHTDIRTAETIKYTANAYLAMRVAFINEVSDICENLGADIEMVAKGIGLDSRIGPKFLQAGPGFGGSCFPKDTLAMQKIAIDANAPSKIVTAVIESNEQRKINMAQKIIKAAGGVVKNKNIGILGITFKANTDDIRASSALVIIEELVRAGASITAFDPEGATHAQKYFADKNINITYATSAEEVMATSNIITIITEWNEFKSLNLATLAGKTLIDLRNLYNPPEMKLQGINYISIGRK